MTQTKTTRPSAAQLNLIRSIAGTEARNARMKASVYEAAERNGFILYSANGYRAELTELGRSFV